jgi:tripartite-type tricarboxylate transporter receptor subunit TctC
MLRRTFALMLTVILVSCGGAAAPATSAPATQAGATASAAPTAAQSDYKDGDTLTVIVPYAAGGGFDVGARLIQPFLQKALKQVTGKDISVIVQNVDGANGQVGVEQIWRAAPDGRKIMYTTQSDMGGFQLRGSPIDVAKFTPIAQIANTTIGWIIRPGVSGINDTTGTFKDIIERSKQKPILFGYTSPDSTKVTIKLLQDAMGFKYDTVSFGGTGDAVASLVRSEIEVYTVSLTTAVQQVKAHPGWRVVVQTGATRDKAVAADIPTMIEAGVPKDTADQITTITDGSRTVHGPPGMSAGNAKALQDAFKIAINDPEFAKTMNDKGQTPLYASPEQVLKKSIDMYNLYIKYKDIILAK